MSNLIPSSLSFDTSILAGNIAPSSMKMYTRDFKAYLDFAVTPDAAIQSSTLARWRTHLAKNTTYSPNTINRMLSAVKRLMDEAEEQNYVPKGTGEDFKRVSGVQVKAMKERRKNHARTRIDPEDMRKLTSLPDPLTLIGIRDYALLHTLASSGLRVHELATLTVKQLHKTQKGYQVEVMGKNDLDWRKAPLSKEAYDAIQEWLARRSVESEYIFTGFEGKGSRPKKEPMKEVSIWRIVKAYANQCGIDYIRPHDFRRFVGTQLAKTNPRNAQRALGHKRIATTMDNYVLDELEVGITDNLY